MYLVFQSLISTICEITRKKQWCSSSTEADVSEVKHVLLHITE